MKSWKLWNEGYSIKDISLELGLTQTSIRKYLKTGNKINKCCYDALKEKQRLQRAVICITTGKIYSSISDAAQDNGLTLKALHRCCNSKYKRLGYSDSGSILIWMYFDDYNIASPEYIEKLKHANPPIQRSITCITTGLTFKNAQRAADYYGIERRNILYCCTGDRNFCGKLENGTPLRWKFTENSK